MLRTSRADIRFLLSLLASLDLVLELGRLVYKRLRVIVEISGHSFLSVQGERPEIHGSFLHVLVVYGGDLPDLEVWFPQHFVVSVFGDNQNRKIGFLGS